MDLKKENSENIASKKEKMKMVIKEGKDFIQKSSDINCFHSHYERCYFFGRVFVLLEQLVEDFYTTNQELDSVVQNVNINVETSGLSSEDVADAVYDKFVSQVNRLSRVPKDNKISEPVKNTITARMRWDTKQCMLARLLKLRRKLNLLKNALIRQINGGPYGI